MLFQEVTLGEFLAGRYPPFLLESFPEQARADRESERAEIQAAIRTGDTLWLWRRVDTSHRTDGSASERGGLAVRHAGKVIRLWLAWEEHSPGRTSRAT
jgi:hypothetical protein